MSSKFQIDSVQTKDRIEYQKQHPELKVTCKTCGKTSLIFNPDDMGDGFKTNVNTYKGVRKLSVAHECLGCQYLQRKKQRVTAENIKTINAPSAEKQLKDAAVKVKKAWYCKKCDLINRGSRKVCRCCGSEKYRWDGVKFNHNPKTKYFIKG